MSFKKILFSVSILLSNTLYQQEIQPRLDLNAQQAWEYFGNKSTIRPQIITSSIETASRPAPIFLINFKIEILDRDLAAK